MNCPLVGCGWCPMMLPDNHEAWYQHFWIEHGVNGYSIRNNVNGEGWDMAELGGGS